MQPESLINFQTVPSLLNAEGNKKIKGCDILALTVTYSVNGKPISFEDLKTLQIIRKDYIDYVEDIIRKMNEAYRQSKKG